MHLDTLPIRALPFLGMLIGLEMLCYRIWKRSYPWAETGASFLVFLGRFPVKILTKLITLPIFALVWHWRVLDFSMTHVFDWVLLFFLFELAYYAYHRCSHERRWLWSEHSVHHSPNRLTLSGAYRLGWTGWLTGTWLFWLPLAFLGFPPTAIFTMLSTNLLYQFWLHTELIPKLGPIEWIFNTPSAHRVHHASNPRYLDRNYGGVLIIFDRLFGTYQEELASDPCIYGLTTPTDERNPFRIALGPIFGLLNDVFQASDWKMRFFILSGSPGAKSEPSEITSKILRAENAKAFPSKSLDGTMLASGP